MVEKQRKEAITAVLVNLSILSSKRNLKQKQAIIQNNFVHYTTQHNGCHIAGKRGH
jgi:hypothetical protein